MFTRRLSAFDRAVMQIERALATSLGAAQEGTRASPAIGVDEGQLEERRATPSMPLALMRINQHGGSSLRAGLVFWTGHGCAR